MIRKIYLVENADEFYDTKTGAAVPYWTYETPLGGDKVLGADGAGATLEQLVDLCDHAAENCNAHEFCGIHRLLGALLYRQVGREEATKAMRFIALRGGLHGMGGICSRGDSYAELGVGVAGRDWDGKFGE